MSSGMLRRVALVRTDVSEKPSASLIGVTRIGELGTTLAATSTRRTLRRNTKSPLGISSQRVSGAVTTTSDSCRPNEGGAKFLRNVGSYKSHTADTILHVKKRFCDACTYGILMQRDFKRSLLKLGRMRT
jgi:hypothetical protein